MTENFIEEFNIIYSKYSNIFSKLSDSKILITGSTGMITKYLSLFLIYLQKRINFELYLQCRNIEKGKEIFCTDVSNKVQILNFDFENNDIPDIHFDYIIHAASPASTYYFINEPVNTISPNAIGTWNLLNTLKDNDVKKFLIMSSNSIYGESNIIKNEVCECDYGIVDPLSRRASYIESKRFAEQLGVAFFRQFNLPVSIIRICHTYGPTFDLNNDERIIPRIIKSFIEKKDIMIYDDKESLIQYTYIADIVAAILIVLLIGENGEAYNAGSNELISLDDAISLMINANENIKSKIIKKQIDSKYKFINGKGVKQIKLSNKKLSSLGWYQLFSNKDGFSRTINYYFNKYNL